MALFKLAQHYHKIPKNQINFEKSCVDININMFILFMSDQFNTNLNKSN